MKLEMRQVLAAAFPQARSFGPPRSVKVDADDGFSEQFYEQIGTAFAVALAVGIVAGVAMLMGMS